MTQRMINSATWGQKSFVLTSGVVAEQGHIACLDTSTGLITKGQASTTLIPIGVFVTSPFPSVTGDGTATVEVQLFSELSLYWFDNDSAPNNVQTANIGSEVYLKDDVTVTTSSAGNSKAGRVFAIDSALGVLIQAGAAVTGPTGGFIGSISGGGVADRTALKAIAAASRFNGMLTIVQSDNSKWVFAASSTATDTTENLVCTPAAGSGRWLRADATVNLSIPITFATADAAVIFTVPTGYTLKPLAQPYWEVSTAFTGGTSASIGLSSSNRTGNTTKGDFISATLLAALTAGVRPGTIGATVDTVAEMAALFLEAANTIRHDRIVDAFTAGVANVRWTVALAATPAVA